MVGIETPVRVPVPCPRCGERQNVSEGAFDPNAEPFGPIGCMVCGHVFSKLEYLSALSRVLDEPPVGLARKAALRPGGD